jgi:hypothetical protein
MATAVLLQEQVIVGSFDLTGFATKGNTEESSETMDQTTFGSGGFRVLAPALRTAAVDIEGFADTTATGVTTLFPASSLGTQYGYSIAPGGGATAGDPVMFGRGLLTAYTPFGGSIGDNAVLTQHITNDTAEVGGLVLAPLASRGALTGTSVTMTGPTATQKVWAILHVTGAVGTNLAVTIQSAPLSNFASPTTRFTFTTVSAVGWQLATPVAGAITDGFWRAICTVGTSTFTWACSIGVTSNV